VAALATVRVKKMTACDQADTRSFDQGANDLQAVADP